MVFLALCLVLFMAAVAFAEDAREFHLHLSEIMGLIGGVVAMIATIIGFFIKRSLFEEIDGIKEKKQDKSMCEQIEAVACRDREEIKADLKDGKREFKYLHRKIDRILWKMQIPVEDEEGGEHE